MSATVALFGTIAVYIVLAILLLSLNIASLWKWWIKAGAIVLTTIVFIAAYLTISGLVGWPAQSPLPARFQLLATRIVEPDKVTGAPGHIYLWVEEVDARHLPIAQPRAFEVPYSVALATETDEAQARISAGDEVLGQVMATGDEEGIAGVDGQPGGDEQGTREGNGGDGQKGSPNSGAADLIGGAAIIVFSDMPVAELPDKGAVELGN